MFALLSFAFSFPSLQAARKIPGLTGTISSSVCPGFSPDCGCSWTKNGTVCGAKDDGSECFCRCCCPYEKSGFECKWKPPPTPPLPPPPPPSPPGVTSPADMIKKMGLGINLGNTLDAPEEGSWAPAAKEIYFDRFKQVHFTNVRVPVRWDKHTQEVPPYQIDPAFLDRVEKVLDWSLARGMVTIMNSHHDDWLDNNTTFAEKLPRFKAIWKQVSERFQSKPETLLFEIYNEPHIMSVDDLNAMNAAVHSIIRVRNPHRIIILGGLQFMSPSWQTSHPGQMKIPRNDSQLMVEVHSYDPFDYAMCGDANKGKCRASWGTPTDVEAVANWMAKTSKWAKDYHLEVYYGEFGCTHHQNTSTGRDYWYQVHAEQIANHSWAASVWDDDGDYRVYNRQSDSFDEGVLRALGKGLARWE